MIINALSDSIVLAVKAVNVVVYRRYPFVGCSMWRPVMPRGYLIRISPGCDNNRES